MDIKGAIEFCQKYVDDLNAGYSCSLKWANISDFREVIELLLEGEVYRQMIAKMKNEKYDVWVSLPGSFTNLPDFVRDIEKEVTGK